MRCEVCGKELPGQNNICGGCSRSDKGMKTIRMESEDGIPVNINGRVIVGETAFTVTDMKWENFGGQAPLRIKATIAELGPYVANHMLFTEDGLTLTGAVLKAMQEYGSPYVYQPLAEHIAGRMSARLSSHIECAQANLRLAEERLEQANAEISRLRSDLKERCMRIDCLNGQAEKDQARIESLNNVIDTMHDAQRRSPIPCLHCFTTEALIKELSSRGATNTVTLYGDESLISGMQARLNECSARDKSQQADIANLRAEAKQYQSEIQRLRERLCCSSSYAAEMLSKSMIEVKDKEIARLREELQRQGMLACAHCTAGSDLDKSRAAASALQFTIKTMSDAMQKQTEEIKHLQSAVGKKRNKSDRLGKKIAAQDAIIHGLNEKLRSLRAAVDGLKRANADLRGDKHDDTVDAMAYALHPNCRCAVVYPDPLNQPDDPWVKEGRSMVIADAAQELVDKILGFAKEDSEEDCVYVNMGPMPEITMEAIERMKGSLMRQIDGRPYAVLCGQCGQVLAEAQAYCDKCGASNRPCSTCRHVTAKPDDDGISCAIGGCNANSKWESKED